MHAAFKDTDNIQFSYKYNCIFTESDQFKYVDAFVPTYKPINIVRTKIVCNTKTFMQTFVVI